jgi:hypothetical protein
MGVTGGHFLLAIMIINLNISTITNIIGMGTTIMAMENTHQNITNMMTDAKHPHILRTVTDTVFYRLLLADGCVAEIVA